MILLARHGSHAEVGIVLSGRSEIPLDEVGKNQAARLADRLADRPLSKVQSSPRRRAIETAAIVAKSHNLPVETVDQIDEIDFGNWTGRRFDELADDSAWRRWNVARGSAATPAGDTMALATARALRHLEAINPTDVVLCVSHCDVIRGVVAHYLGLNVDRILSFDIDPASVTTICRRDGVARLIAINERVS